MWQPIGDTPYQCNRPPTTPGSSQSKANGKSKSKSKSKSTQTFSRQDIEQICEYLQQLPEKPKATQTPNPICQPEVSRVDYYLAHLNATHPYFPVGLNYLVGDGFYSKQKFVDGVVALNLHLVSKLRVDAD